MKNTKLCIITILAFVLSNNIIAQIKVKDGGKVLVGYNNVEGSDRLTVDGSTNTTTRGVTIRVNHDADWGQSSMAKVTRPKTVSWVVNYSGKDMFYVAGYGWIYSSGHYVGSDSTIKHNITTISSPITKISALRGVTYNYKPILLDSNCGGDGSTYYTDSATYMGLIAQEVEGTVPEVVKTFPRSSTENIKTVNYASLVGLLIEGIKAQAVQISDLSGQVEALTTNFTTLQTVLSSLQSTVDECCSSVQFNSGGSQLIGTDKKPSLGILYQNRPNPYSHSCTIDYEILVQPETSYIAFFDMHGTFIKKVGNLTKGKNSIQISKDDFSSGMYLFSLIVNGREVDTKRMIFTP